MRPSTRPSTSPSINSGQAQDRLRVCNNTDPTFLFETMYKLKGSYSAFLPIHFSMILRFFLFNRISSYHLKAPLMQAWLTQHMSRDAGTRADIKQIERMVPAHHAIFTFPHYKVQTNKGQPPHTQKTYSQNNRSKSVSINKVFAPSLISIQ